MKNKMFKLLSVLLTLAVILSTCICMVGTVSAAEAVFYVSAEGSDENAGTSLETAVATLGKAVELANVQYGAGDNITIKLTGTEVQLGTVPEYAYDLAVEGIDETKTQITTTSSKGIIANGPASATSFNNVSFSGPQYVSFLFNNSKKVVFDANTSGFSVVQYAVLGTYTDGGSNKTSNGHDIEFNGPAGYIYLSNSGWQSKTVAGNLNITVAGGGSPLFIFNPSSNSGITLQKNLNLNIKKANSISFSNPTGARVTVDGAIQIINSTGSTTSVNDAVLSAIDCDKYVITNVTGKADIIEFTETPGKFKVDKSATTFDVIATDKDGNVTKADENGYLTLPKSGDYELSLYRDPITAVYYVSAKTGATDNDGTKTSPFLTVFDAINQGITDGYTNKDTVVVKLLDEETIQWGDVQTTPAHTFKLVVESVDRNNYSSVNILQATYLGGPTELKYGIYKINDTYSQIRINNKDFIIDSTAHISCNYYTFGDNSTSNSIDGQKVIFRNPISTGNINLSNNLHSNGKKYVGDLEVVVDNPDAKPVLRLGGYDGKVYYKANVNFNVKEATGISFGSQSKGTNSCEGAIQLIANSNAYVDPDGLDYLENTCNPTKGFYYIINKSDYKDALEFTTTEGKYAVDTETYAVTAVGENGTFEAQNGFLTVGGAGTYTITINKKAEEADNTIYEKLDNVTINLWEKDGEITIDNAESVATIDLGNKTYNDVKINIANAQKITFVGNPTVTNTLQVAVGGEVQVVGKDVIDGIIAANGKWYVVNNSGCEIGFGKEYGEVVYQADGKELEAICGDKVIEPKFKNFMLDEGEAEIKVKAKQTDKYSDYIDYRGNNLSNTYAKIKNGEKINVVYYGGSVTNGSGASNSNVTSWRALVGQWLKNVYTNADITNINSAIGATGSYYGSYRLERHVLEKEPDLFIIEFSINDFLDWHYSGKDYRKIASQQMETIIRRVRTMYPDCDIVMLHTTDKTVASGYTSKGNYYPEAQAHNDIAKAYNIPTIDIGGSLINYMGENWATDEVWNQYLTDTVHPSDKGYQVYFDTIKEYLTNTLIYGENSTEVKNHQMPEMVNDVLLDGDIKYYALNKEALENSSKLGGDGFVYVPSELFDKNTYGGIRSQDTNSVFTIEFEGTEIGVVHDTTSSHTGYLVKIDNGEYYTVKRGGYLRPLILAEGLQPGKHTLSIKQYDESKTMTIVCLYSRDETKATQKGTEPEHTFTNYTPNNDATCQKNGTETAVCDCGCGETDTRDIPDSTVDCKFENYVSDENATCKKDGTETASCEFGCGETDTRDVANSKKAHTYTTTTTKATLKANGKIVKKCSACGTVASTTTIKYAKTFKLSTTTYTYNGKAKTPTVTVKDSAGKTLKKNVDYKVTYASGRKKVGTYKVTIKMMGKYSGTKTLTFKINPVKTKVSKLTAAKKMLTVTISKKSSQVTGYQIQYSTSKKFTSAKTKTVSSYKTTKVTLKGLKAKKTYYVRVRTYKKVGGKVYYSGWSTVKYKKTK